MKRRLRFTTRTLLVLLLVSSLPCWWIASEMAQHRAEHAAVKHMRQINPRSSVVWESRTPDWLSKIGVKASWMDRVTRVDATGVTCGNLKWEDYPKSQINFGDENLADIADDLKMLVNLREIHFQVTKLSDNSLDIFASLPNIEMICLHETNVTDLGAKRLKSRMPSTIVDHKQAGTK